jgi:hypothetical protein
LRAASGRAAALGAGPGRSRTDPSTTRVFGCRVDVGPVMAHITSPGLWRPARGRRPGTPKGPHPAAGHGQPRSGVGSAWPHKQMTVEASWALPLPPLPEDSPGHRNLSSEAVTVGSTAGEEPHRAHVHAKPRLTEPGVQSAIIGQLAGAGGEWRVFELEHQCRLPKWTKVSRYCTGMPYCSNAVSTALCGV